MKTCDECKNYKQKELAAHLESIKPKLESNKHDIHWQYSGELPETLRPTHIKGEFKKLMTKQDRKELFERGRSVGEKQGYIKAITKLNSLIDQMNIDRLKELAT
jgi:hypothetical protein